MAYGGVILRQSEVKLSFKFVVIIMSVILTVVILGLLQINKNMSDQLHQSIKSELESHLIQQQELIQLEFEYTRLIFTTIAKSISNSDIDKSAMGSYLNEQIQGTTFDSIYYIGLDGTGISNTGQVRDFTDEYAFIDGLNTSEVRAKANTVNSQTTIDVYTSVYRDGLLDGVLIAEYPLSSLSGKIVGINSLGSYTIITDRDGETLFSTSKEYLALDRDTLNEADFILGDTPSEIVSNLYDLKSGYTYFNVGDITRMAVYRPLNYNNWQLIIVADEHFVGEETRVLTEIMVYSSIVASFLICVFVLYIFYSKYTAIKDMEQVAYYDELTGLPNTTKLKLEMAKLLKTNKDKDFIIIKCDINSFKAINEMFTFDIGNKVLKSFKKVRESVDEETLIVARTGVDQFIFFAGNGFFDKLEERAHLYEAGIKLYVPELNRYPLTFNYGRYFIPKGEEDIDDILNKVVIAHTMAKQNKGKKTTIVHNYDDSYKNQIILHAKITNEMYQALEQGEFIPYLQPKFRISDNKLIGAEALVRWIKPSGEMVYPDVFIPLFEANGFITTLDKYVLESVCQNIRRWIDAGYELFPVAVNFSRGNLENDKFVEEIKEIVDRYSLPHNLIEIELTESAIINNEKIFESILKQLSDEGFVISIDDFGSGYSSLGLLKNLNIHTLKLDRSFFVNSSGTRGDLVVHGIVKLAHSLNMQVVAEGIEEQVQVDFLKSIGCEYGQGYFFARPMPIEQLERDFI